AEQGKETFIHAGGELFTYIECLNDSAMHIEMMASLVKR
ncbi:ferrochelatase, partial [Vibrio anguillarum]